MKSILKPFKAITQYYKKSSNWGKVLFFFVIISILLMTFKSQSKREGYEDRGDFLFKSGNEVYDDFYSNIYDHLVFSGSKTDYEINQIIGSTKPTDGSVILDIGSGTGHHVAILNKKGYKAVGLDTSQSMISQSKKNYPDYDFVRGNVMNAMQFQPETFTHILCLYFTLYYIKDKSVFFRNCFNWLMPGGSLVVHMVDRENFDPIIPPANPLLMLTPQRYAKQRITKSKVTFDDFKYDANFVLDNNTNSAKFVETFKNKNSGKIFRKHEHKMYMESEPTIIDIAAKEGFVMSAKIDLIKSGYEYNYLYVFSRPS
jgi:SAM-dependent methyltransferase